MIVRTLVKMSYLFYKASLVHFYVYSFLRMVLNQDNSTSFNHNPCIQSQKVMSCHGCDRNVLYHIIFLNPVELIGSCIKKCLSSSEKLREIRDIIRTRPATGAKL